MSGLIIDGDDVSYFHRDRRDVDSSPIEPEMAMIDPLPTFPASGGEPQAVDNVIEALFKQDNEVFPRIATLFFSPGVDQLELFLQYAINEAEFLFFNELACIFALFAPSFGCLSSNTWFVGISEDQRVYAEIIASLEDRSS